jgi:hypothetical protein
MMDFDRDVKIRVYRHFAVTGLRPDVGTIAAALGVASGEVGEAFRRLRAARVLYLEPDGETIRMAPPFSAVPTQHEVVSGPVRYFANCAWDALGIPAALHRTAIVRSRCEQSMEPLLMDVTASGPHPSDWVFHCLVPAARWWDDLPFT